MKPPPELSKLADKLISKCIEIDMIAFVCFFPDWDRENPDQVFVSPVMCSSVNANDTGRIIEAMAEAQRNERKFKRTT